jgi:MFS superfamily sulfate permease-like transporter
MPQPTLAAIVIAAMLHLTKPHYLRELFVRSRWSFMNAVIVIGAELTLGVMQGIALGIVLSLLELIYVSSHLQGAVLGQLPGTEAYRDVRRHPEARTFPGLLIWRVGGDLFFASVGQMEIALKNSLAEIRPPIKHVLLDMSSVNFIDVSACDELITFVKHLQSQGVTIAFARVRDNVRQDMQLAKIKTVVESADFYERITDGIRAWQRQEPGS